MPGSQRSTPDSRDHTRSPKDGEPFHKLADGFAVRLRRADEEIVEIPYLPKERV